MRQPKTEQTFDSWRFSAMFGQKAIRATNESRANLKHFRAISYTNNAIATRLHARPKLSHMVSEQWQRAGLVLRGVDQKSYQPVAFESSVKRPGGFGQNDLQRVAGERGNIYSLGQ